MIFGAMLSSLDLIKVILGVFYIAICAALIVVVMMQRSKEDGLSGAITGQSSESFYSKNKGGMNKEKFLMQLTIVLSVCFVVVAIILSILMRSGT